MNFVEERTEHRFTLFWTDIDVIRPKNLTEFVLMENSERVSTIILVIVQLKLI